MYIPQRGHFIWLNFNPQAGHEQMGNRPALGVSQDAFNQQLGFVYVCPVSNTKRSNPFYVPIPPGLALTGVIMSDQLRTLDYRARQAVYIAECPKLVLQEVLRRIKPILF